MLPENRMNPLGLSPQGAAATLGNVGSAATPAPPEPAMENPAEAAIQMNGRKFGQAFKLLEGMNAELGGDAGKFRDMQKAMETWFADIAAKSPTSPEPSTY